MKSPKDLRRTFFDGYSSAVEFYSPGYGELPSNEDFRRTLFWNPYVRTNKEGYVDLRICNTGTCRQLIISAEAITPDGNIVKSRWYFVHSQWSIPEEKLSKKERSKLSTRIILFTLHPGKRPVYRGLRGLGEEWRVFHESIVYSIFGIKNPRGWSCILISYGRFCYAVWTAYWQIWRQLAVLGKTVDCSR